MPYLPNLADTRAIIGPAGSGKTEALMRLAAEYAAQGTVLVLVAQPQTVPVMRRRLDAAEIAGVRVATPRELALDILATPEARAFTGRKPYVLTPGEEDILTADLQTCGMDGKRLREMFKFFKKSFTELADTEDGFLVSDEERKVMELYRELAAGMRGLLECEVSAQAVKFLRHGAVGSDAAAVRAAEAFAYDFVLADDCDLISAASQELAARLARRGFVAAGNPDAVIRAFESYPAPATFAAFAEAAATVECMNAPEPAAAEHIAYTTPEKELLGVAGTVRALIADGCAAEDICIAAPNKTWLKNLITACKHVGVQTDGLSTPSAFTITTGEPGKSVPSRALAGLALVVDPTDSGAWRMWCAFDDLMAETIAFQTVRRNLRERAVPVPVVLERYMLDTENEASALRVDRDLARAWDLITACEGQTGPALMGKLGEALGEASSKGFHTFAKLCAAAEGESAATIYARVRRALSLPTVTGHGVFVGLYDQVAGLSPRILMLPGFVNGFFPDVRYFDDTANSIDKRRKMHEADAMRLARVTGTARERIIVTTFSETDLESASLLRVKIDRIRLRGERRVCAIPASDFLVDVVGTAKKAKAETEAPAPGGGTITAPAARTVFPKE